MKIVDLFCGAGGMSYGFEMAGFTSILAIDKWEDAILTYNFNRKNKCGTNMDIHDFDNDRLVQLKTENNVVGIVGGPPCQGFSLVGTRKVSDPRNSLYIEYVRFVSLIKPSFFVLENVSGLLSLDSGKYKADIIERFDKLGYNVNFSLLTASDYGVPQMRKRVFFIGLKRNTFGNVFFDFNLLKKKKMISTQDAIGDLPSLMDEPTDLEYLHDPKNSFQVKMRKRATKITNHDITNHTSKTIQIVSKVPDGGSIKDLPQKYYSVRNYNNAFRRMNSKLPSNTIDCGHRNYFHYEFNRVPTVRESARIQSFPDDYVFKGSKTSQYTQVGNAVPPLLAYYVANEIYKLIKKSNASSSI